MFAASPHQAPASNYGKKQPSASYDKPIRTGLMLARVGSEHRVRLPDDFVPAYKASKHVTVPVRDWASHPELHAHAKWRCNHPRCEEKVFPTKEVLADSHPADAARTGEIHLAYAVATIPPGKEIPGRPASKGRVDPKTGEVLEGPTPKAEAIPERAATLFMLLSDEL